MSTKALIPGNLSYSFLYWVALFLFGVLDKRGLLKRIQIWLSKNLWTKYQSDALYHSTHLLPGGIQVAPTFRLLQKIRASIVL
jgi:hypothetical protein